MKDVIAPADGIITLIARMPTFFTTIKNEDLKDYRIILTHSCTFYTIYIHVYKLSPKLEEAVSNIQPSENRNVKILVKAGEVIGKANAFDFSVHNEDVKLSGFVVPVHYDREPWKIYTVDPFDYFVEPLKSQLLEKNLRTVKPYGGKIDHDIDGKLIGNWFVENTNGYMGIKQPDYWGTHLSISPNALDPKHIVFSIGDFKGEFRSSKQYGIKGNFPNPSDVGIDSGIIKYELVPFEYKDIEGNVWYEDRFATGIKAFNLDKEVVGTILLELVGKRKLKLEVFLNKKASDVNIFTERALIYER